MMTQFSYLGELEEFYGGAIWKHVDMNDPLFEI